MKLKPLPKLLLIVGIVGSVGFALNNYLQQKRSEPVASAKIEEQAPAKPVDLSPPAPASPAPVSSTPTPAPESNQGLSKLLQSGQSK